MKDFVIVAAVAISLCFFGGVFAMIVYEDEIDTGNRVKSMIKKCEESLPRNQYCTLVAVHKEQDNAYNQW